MDNLILQVLADTLSDVIVSINENSILTFCSPAIGGMFGYTVDEVVGNNLTMIMPERLRAMHMMGLKRYLSTGVKTLDWRAVEAIGLRKDGTEFPLEISFGEYEVGEERHLSGVLRDITIRKTQEEKVLSEKEALERVNNELEQFGYAVSHDLQEPIRAIYSYAALAQKGETLEPNTERYIKNIEDNARRLENFVRTLLKHAQAGKVVNSDVLPSNTVVKEVLVALQASIEESDANILLDQLINVDVDAMNLRRVFQNLIENSIKFRKPDTKPVIQIVSKLIYNYVQFAVIDNGIGIDNKHFSRLFTLFQRLPNKEEYKGTGLGLAMVKKIVESHNGRVSVESELGVGTTVYFTLPKGDL